MGEETYHLNPRDLVPDWAWSVLTLWRLFQGGGMGVGPLPEPGGSLDQPCALISAFFLMSGFERDLLDDGEDGQRRRKRRKRLGQAEVAAIRAGVDKALELYPDGSATGALLAAVMKARNRETDLSVDQFKAFAR